MERLHSSKTAAIPTDAGGTLRRLTLPDANTKRVTLSPKLAARLEMNESAYSAAGSFSPTPMDADASSANTTSRVLSALLSLISSLLPPSGPIALLDSLQSISLVSSPGL